MHELFEVRGTNLSKINERWTIRLISLWRLGKAAASGDWGAKSLRRDLEDDTKSRASIPGGSVNVARGIHGDSGIGVACVPRINKVMQNRFFPDDRTRPRQLKYDSPSSNVADQGLECCAIKITGSIDCQWIASGP